MEAVSLGIPAIAISYAGHNLDVMPTWRERLERLVKSILSHALLPTPTFLNINLPPIAADQAKGVRVTTLGSRVYMDSLKRMKDPFGRDCFWIGGGSINWTGTERSDISAINEGFVSVTPLQLDLTHHASMDAARALKLEL